MGRRHSSSTLLNNPHYKVSDEGEDKKLVQIFVREEFHDHLHWSGRILAHAGKVTEIRAIFRVGRKLNAFVDNYFEFFI